MFIDFRRPRVLMASGGSSGGGVSASGSASSSRGEPSQQVIGSPFGGAQSDQYLLDQIVKQFPQLFNSLNGQLPGFTNAASTATNQALGSTAQAGAQDFGQYAPGINQTQQGLGASNLMSNAGAIGSLLNSPTTSQIGQGFQQGQQGINQSYGPSMSGLNSLMSNINPNQFTGSQIDQIGRGLAQQNYQGGNSNVNNPLTSLNNAMTFGTGLQNMQTQFGNLASQSANTANTLNGGQNIFGMASGLPSGTGSANTSVQPGNFLQTPSTAASLTGMGTAFGTAGMNQLGSTYNTANSAAAGQQNNTAGSASGGVGCCWILTYGNEGYLPWFVRELRDIGYKRNPSVARGYTWMSRWLVPVMMLFEGIDELVKELMVFPLTEHCGFIKSVRGCRSHCTYQKFWFLVWGIIGYFVKKEKKKGVK